MVDYRIVGMGATLTLAFYMLAQSPTPAKPIVAGRNLDNRVAELEAVVGAEPNNAVALHSLVSAYLARGAPGLAQAALDRAAPGVKKLPSIADQRARTLALLGHPQRAFVAQSAVLTECDRGRCTPELEGRARYRLAWLRQLLELEVTDPRAQPERALLALRLASPLVQLEVD